MVATVTVNVAHGLTLSNIRGITATIRNDDDTAYVHFLNSTTTGSPTGENRLSATASDISLRRQTNGVFDNSIYDATSYNRGWITITYIA